MTGDNILDESDHYLYKHNDQSIIFSFYKTKCSITLGAGYWTLMKERFIFLLQENIIFLRRVEASKLPCHIHKHCIHTYLTQKCICENILLFWMIFFNVGGHIWFIRFYFLIAFCINKSENWNCKKRQWLGERAGRGGVQQCWVTEGRNDWEMTVVIVLLSTTEWTTALCNLQTQGSWDRKQEIALLIKYSYVDFEYFWRVFWPMLLIFLLLNIKTWRFPNKIKGCQ